MKLKTLTSLIFSLFVSQSALAAAGEPSTDAPSIANQALLFMGTATEMIKGERDTPEQKKALIQAELKKIAAAATADNIPKEGATEQEIAESKENAKDEFRTAVGVLLGEYQKVAQDESNTAGPNQVLKASTYADILALFKSESENLPTEYSDALKTLSLDSPKAPKKKPKGKKKGVRFGEAEMQGELAVDISTAEEAATAEKVDAGAKYSESFETLKVQLKKYETFTIEKGDVVQKFVNLTPEERKETISSIESASGLAVEHAMLQDGLEALGNEKVALREKLADFPANLETDADLEGKDKVEQEILSVKKSINDLLDQNDELIRLQTDVSSEDWKIKSELIQSVSETLETSPDATADDLSSTFYTQKISDLSAELNKLSLTDLPKAMSPDQDTFAANMKTLNTLQQMEMTGELPPMSVEQQNDITSTQAHFVDYQLAIINKYNTDDGTVVERNLKSAAVADVKKYFTDSLSVQLQEWHKKYSQGDLSEADKARYIDSFEQLTHIHESGVDLQHSANQALLEAAKQAGADLGGLYESQAKLITVTNDLKTVTDSPSASDWEKSTNNIYNELVEEYRDFVTTSITSVSADHAADLAMINKKLEGLGASLEKIQSSGSKGGEAKRTGLLKRFAEGLSTLAGRSKSLLDGGADYLHLITEIDATRTQLKKIKQTQPKSVTDAQTSITKVAGELDSAEVIDAAGEEASTSETEAEQAAKNSAKQVGDFLEGISSILGKLKGADKAADKGSAEFRTKLNTLSAAAASLKNSLTEIENKKYISAQGNIDAAVISISEVSTKLSTAAGMAGVENLAVTADSAESNIEATAAADRLDHKEGLSKDSSADAFITAMLDGDGVESKNAGELGDDLRASFEAALDNFVSVLSKLKDKQIKAISPADYKALTTELSDLQTATSVTVVEQQGDKLKTTFTAAEKGFAGKSLADERILADLKSLATATAQYNATAKAPGGDDDTTTVDRVNHERTQAPEHLPDRNPDEDDS
jgi:type II secretory pathway component PulM